jgi:hypothetical protein
MGKDKLAELAGGRGNVVEFEGMVWECGYYTERGEALRLVLEDMGYIKRQ